MEELGLRGLEPPAFGTAYAPACTVTAVVLAFELTLCEGGGRATVQERARIVAFDALARSVADIRTTRHRAKSWRSMKERQAQGIQDRALPRAGGTYDGEDPAGFDGRGVETQLKRGRETRQVFAAYG